MSIRWPIMGLSLAILACGFLQLAKADPVLPMRVVPHAPPGYLLVDENLWSELMDEAGKHLDRARESYLNGHVRTAALELRKAAIMMRIDAGHSQDHADWPMQKSAQDLDRLSQRLLHPASMYDLESIDDLDAVSSRALAALAEHEQVKADLAWKRGQGASSGRYLRSAADNLERAAYRARVAVSASTAATVRSARALSSRLVEGTGYVVDEVGRGIDALGRQIRQFGQGLERPLQRR